MRDNNPNILPSRQLSVCRNPRNVTFNIQILTPFIDLLIYAVRELQLNMQGFLQASQHLSKNHNY